MNQNNIFKFANGLNNFYPPKEEQNSSELACSRKMTEIINSNELEGEEYSDLRDMRSLTIAHSLFDSNMLSVFDEDSDLDDFLNNVFMIKLKAHIPAFEAALHELLKDGYTDKKNSFLLQSDTSVFALESLSTRKYEKNVTQKSLIYFDNQLNAIAITAYYRRNELIRITSTPLTFLTLKHNYKIINEVNDTEFCEMTFDLDINYRSGARMNMTSMNETKEALGVINHVSSCLGLDIDFKF